MRPVIRAHAPPRTSTAISVRVMAPALMVIRADIRQTRRPRASTTLARSA
jgi:hypothetical protein